MLRWYRNRRARHELANADARDLIARYGVRAHAEARRRLSDMRDNAVIDANRPQCHWKRVRRLVAQCLPDDQPDAAAVFGAPEGSGPAAN